MRLLLRRRRQWCAVLVLVFFPVLFGGVSCVACVSCLGLRFRRCAVRLFGRVWSSGGAFGCCLSVPVAGGGGAVVVAFSGGAALGVVVLALVPCLAVVARSCRRRLVSAGAVAAVRLALACVVSAVVALVAAVAGSPVGAVGAVAVGAAGGVVVGLVAACWSLSVAGGGGLLSLVAFANKGVCVMILIKTYGNDKYPYHVRFIFTTEFGLAYIQSNCKDRHHVAKLLTKFRVARQNLKVLLRDSTSKPVKAIMLMHGLYWLAMRQWLLIQVDIPYGLTWWLGRFKRRKKTSTFKPR